VRANVVLPDWRGPVIASTGKPCARRNAVEKADRFSIFAI